MADKRSLPNRAGRFVASSVLGVLIVDVAKSARRSGALRQAAVTATAWGLRGARRVEVGAEGARLAGGDILAEARARNGEQAPAPGTDVASGHDHEH